MSDFIIKTKKIILLGGDIAMLYGALYLTLAIRYGLAASGAAWERHLIPFSLVFIFWLIIFFINEFYDLKISYNTQNLVNALAKFFLANAAVAVAIFYFLAPIIDSIKPQRVLIIDLAISFVLIFLWRKFFYNFIKSPAIINRVLIIGQSPLAAELAAEIAKRPQLGFKAESIPGLPDDLKDFCLKKNIDILTSARELKNDREAAKKIFDCLSLGIDVHTLSGFYEQITNKIPVEAIDHGWFLENLSEHSKKVYEIAKRFSDILISAVGLVCSLPLVPLFALAIRLDSRGPIFFRQIRTGKNGREFLAVKFRSMVDGAEKNGPQWAAENDQRVTRVGKFMRKTRLDEIPQFVNILRGEMSFVGPRPERPEFVASLAEKIPFYRERLLVKPGLTGWAQLNGPSYGGSEKETWEKLKYDLYYLKNRSLILDASIMLKTIRVALSGKGQ